MIDANPACAYVRFINGRETTVSIRDIAPCASSDVANNETVRDGDISIVHDTPDFLENDANSERNNEASDDASVLSETAWEPSGSNVVPNRNPSCRSTRSRKPVLRYGAAPYM